MRAACVYLSGEGLPFSASTALLTDSGGHCGEAEAGAGVIRGGDDFFGFLEIDEI